MSKATNLIGLIYNPRISEAKKLALRVKDGLGLNETWLASALDVEQFHQQMERTSLVITFGGDGTILRAAHLSSPYSVPILGVNLGRVGFIAEIKADQALEKIPHYLDGDSWIEERLMLMATLLPGGKGANGDGREAIHALNDVVVGRGTESNMIDIEARIDGALFTTYRADGLIVATATGSTGYSLSAGGPIVHPEMKVIILQPVASHLCMSECVVIPSEASVELKLHGPYDATLSIDGFSHFNLSPGDRVVVQKSPHMARFLRAHPRSRFYGTLTQRLGIGTPRMPNNGENSK